MSEDSPPEVSEVIESLADPIDRLSQTELDRAAEALEDVEGVFSERELKTQEEVQLFSGVVELLDSVVDAVESAGETSNLLLQVRCRVVIDRGQRLLSDEERIIIVAEETNPAEPPLVTFAKILARLLPPESVLGDPATLHTTYTFHEISNFAPMAVDRGVERPGRHVDAIGSMLLDAEQYEIFDVTPSGYEKRDLYTIIISFVSAVPTVVRKVDDVEVVVEQLMEEGHPASRLLVEAHRTVTSEDDDRLPAMDELPDLSGSVHEDSVSRSVVRMDPHIHPVLSSNKSLTGTELRQLWQEKIENVGPWSSLGRGMSKLTVGAASQIGPKDHHSCIRKYLTQDKNNYIFDMACLDLNYLIWSKRIGDQERFSLYEYIRNNPLLYHPQSLGIAAHTVAFLIRFGCPVGVTKRILKSLSEDLFAGKIRAMFSATVLANLANELPPDHINDLIDESIASEIDRYTLERCDALKEGNDVAQGEAWTLSHLCELGEDTGAVVTVFDTITKCISSGKIPHSEAIWVVMGLMNQYTTSFDESHQCILNDLLIDAIGEGGFPAYGPFEEKIPDGLLEEGFESVSTTVADRLREDIDYFGVYRVVNKLSKLAENHQRSEYFCEVFGNLLRDDSVPPSVKSQLLHLLVPKVGHRNREFIVNHIGEWLPVGRWYLYCGDRRQTLSEILSWEGRDEDTVATVLEQWIESIPFRSSCLQDVSAGVDSLKTEELRNEAELVDQLREACMEAVKKERADRVALMKILTQLPQPAPAVVGPDF